MANVPSWDQYYLSICGAVAARSKDPNTQVGCVIAGPAHEIRSTGYNSLPRASATTFRNDWSAHEVPLDGARRAQLNLQRGALRHTAGRLHHLHRADALHGLRASHRAGGIREVVVSGERMREYSSDQYNEHFRLVETLFEEAGVKVRRA